MATSILPGGHSHFDHGPQFYPQTMYQDFSQHNTVLPGSHSQFAVPNTQDDSISLNASQTWPSQLSSRRASSKSPNVSERTPIRHNRVNQSRTRSTSGTDALLAYATGQSLQQQQQQQPSLNTPPVLQQTTPMSSPPMFPSQNFTSMSPSSPFLQQQNYYDNSNSAFTDMPGQHISQGVSEYYPLTRNEIHASPMSTTSMNPQEAMYMQHASQARSQTLPSMSAQSLNFPPTSRPLESTPGNIEVSSSRNKPQCWDHGCNGRQFSTFSNLLRHQREKSGTAAKARCPHCGTEFTRTTARNGHMYGGKCKGMPDASKRSSMSESIENGDE